MNINTFVEDYVFVKFWSYVAICSSKGNNKHENFQEQCL